MLRRIVSALAGVLIAGLIAGPAFAEPVNKTFFGTALKGYDTVAYHAAGRTVEQLQAAQIMDEYKDWIEYDEDNDVNIANAYRTLSEQTR